MKISILGAAGFLGRKVAARLAQDGKLGGRPIAALTLMDLVAPANSGGRISDHRDGWRPRGPAARGYTAWH